MFKDGKIVSKQTLAEKASGQQTPFAGNDVVVSRRLSYVVRQLEDKDQDIRILSISFLGKMGSLARDATPALLALEEFLQQLGR